MARSSRSSRPCTSERRLAAEAAGAGAGVPRRLGGFSALTAFFSTPCNAAGRSAACREGAKGAGVCRRRLGCSCSSCHCAQHVGKAIASHRTAWPYLQLRHTSSHCCKLLLLLLLLHGCLWRDGTTAQERRQCLLTSFLLPCHAADVAAPSFKPCGVPFPSCHHFCSCKGVCHRCMPTIDTHAFAVQ